ncbi:MAG TPA: cation:proton antiporter [Steroidobacteraceae bacterium]|nr:cation:proton antiporter [Steroidobacteraceae bacterium]
MAHEPSVAIFIAQIVVLLLAGRLLGELMQQLRQPAVIGQLIAGLVLGPSIFGALAPVAWHSLFPSAPEQRAMLDAVSQLGIVLLLLMTGMETDLSVFRDARRPALCISGAGILVPFACGCTLGALLPESMLPVHGQRVITALFLGTALSISSVKIVALVVRDLGFLRRTVGQVIIASSILDDTIGWVIMSVTFGLALHGTLDFMAVARSVIGTVLFLVLSFTVGRQLVFRILRWSNDSLSGEMVSVSTIVVLAGALALLTNAIGVHLVLGAFVAGVLIGQAPILPRELHDQLRGLIVALFMPVFFAVAGLTTDLGALAQPHFLWLTLGLIALASFGKFSGAFVGGRLGGLSWPESFAVGCGMNARGSTEVIVATIGLQVGALSLHLYTAIVAMALVTTLAMPPMLRWAFARLPATPAERGRLEREEEEARGFLPQVERLLVAVDDSPSGNLASRIAGLLAGVRGIPTTLLELQPMPADPAGSSAPRPASLLKAAAARGRAADADAGAVNLRMLTESREDASGAIAAEAHKGYGLLLVGREPALVGGTFGPQIVASVAGAAEAFAIVIARAGARAASGTGPLKILVPVSGTALARQGAEIAVALAHASQGSVTALYADSSSEPLLRWPGRLGSAIAPPSSANASVHEIVALGRLYGVPVHGRVRKAASARRALLQELSRVDPDLLVMAVAPRAGAQLFFGELAAQMLADAGCSLLFLCPEPLPEALSAR